MFDDSNRLGYQQIELVKVKVDRPLLKTELYIQITLAAHTLITQFVARHFVSSIYKYQKFETSHETMR